MAVQSEWMLSIVLSPDLVTAAQVRLVEGEMVVSHIADLAPPEGAFDGVQLAGGEALGRALAGFLAEKGFSARRAVIVLPGPAAITQLIKLPPMPREDRLGAVRAVAERYAIFAEHSIAADCAVVEEAEEDGAKVSHVLLAAAREALVEQCQECARAAGLELLAVDVPPVAIARGLRERFPAAQTVALAMLGETKSDVMIHDDGVLRLCYSANVGLGGAGSEPASGERAFTPPPQLYSELSHCFRFFQNQFPRKAVERVLLSADHPRAQDIAAHLSQELQLPVELVSAAQATRLPEHMDAEAAWAARGGTLAVLRGSALGAREHEGPAAINLLPEASGLWKLVRRPALASAAGMAALLALSLAWGWSLNNKLGLQERRLSSVKAEIARLQPELEMLRAARATEQALRSEVERETARIARERAVRWSQILVDVSERLPHDMWLTSLTSPDSSRISLTGIALNRETIPRAIESLSSSPYLEDVVLGSLNKDDAYAPGRPVIRYQINGRLLRGMLVASPAAPAPAHYQEVAQ